MESKPSFDQSLEKNMREFCIHMLGLLCKKTDPEKIAGNKKAGTAIFSLKHSVPSKYLNHKVFLQTFLVLLHMLHKLKPNNNSNKYWKDKT